MKPVIQVLYNSILEGEENNAAANVQTALQDGVDPAEILNIGMIAAMAEVGKRFESGNYWLPEMMVSAVTMQAGLVVLKPYLGDGTAVAAGKVVIGTVEGDIHDIGKNLVGMMLEGAGFRVEDLGSDVSPQKFVEAVQSFHPDIVALSALLTTTMPYMKTTIDALKEAGLREQVKVIIGGAPITEDYAHQIEADGYSPDAMRAVTLAKTFMAN